MVKRIAALLLVLCAFVVPSVDAQISQPPYPYVTRSIFWTSATPAGTQVVGQTGFGTALVQVVISGSFTGGTVNLTTIAGGFSLGSGTPVPTTCVKLAFGLAFGAAQTTMALNGAATTTFICQTFGGAMSVNVNPAPVGTGTMWVYIAPGNGGPEFASHPEDLAHTSGDVGVPAWAVRNDTGATTFTDTNGDYSPIGVNAQGAVLSQAVQNLGRSRVMFTADRVTPAATDTLVTFVKNVSGTATTGQTTYTVTAGKTFRVQAIHVGVADSTTTAVSARVALRENTGGACVASSAAAVMHYPATPAAVAAEGSAGTSYAIPDGLEFPAADSICISAIASTATGTVTVSVTGFEY